MNLQELKYCPARWPKDMIPIAPLSCAGCSMARKVSHILPYDAPKKNEEDAEKFMENRKRISISGVQEKLSLLLEKNQLRLTEEGEQGTYILKPIPRDLKKVDQVPANEHLTMQLAHRYMISQPPITG